MSRKGKQPLMIPTIAFAAPHWELVFEGRLAIKSVVGSSNGKETLYACKTRKDSAYSHRGLVLCYTSLKNHVGPMRSNDFDNDDVGRGVVGCAQIVDVVCLTEKDKRILFAAYNNAFGADLDELAALYKRRDTIYPMDYGYLMKPVHLFKKPIEDLGKKYMYGPIGRIPLLPKIAEQLPEWAQTAVERMRV